MTQRLHLVFGGELVDPQTNVFRDVAQIHIVGMFPNYESAFRAWKGEARYHSLLVKGELNPDAVWYYPDPRPEAAEIRGRMAFWKGVAVTD